MTKIDIEATREKIEKTITDAVIKDVNIGELTQELLDLFNVMLSLPTDEEIDKIVRLEGKNSEKSEFAEMCMREGAKLLRDKLKRSES